MEPVTYGCVEMKQSEKTGLYSAVFSVNHKPCLNCASDLVFACTYSAYRQMLTAQVTAKALYFRQMLSSRLIQDESRSPATKPTNPPNSRNRFSMFTWVGTKPPKFAMLHVITVVLRFYVFNVFFQNPKTRLLRLCLVPKLSYVFQNTSLRRAAVPTLGSRVQSRGGSDTPTPPAGTRSVLELEAGVISSGNAWERRSQSYFDSGNGVPRNGVPRTEIVRYSFITLQ